MAVIKPKEIDDFSILSDTISIGAQGSGYSSIDYGAIPTITATDTLTLGNISFNNTITSSTYTLGSGIDANTVWTTSGTGSAIGGLWSNPGTTIDQGGKMSLRGDNADIDINGKSMKAWMEKVEDRLNILTPNPELEKDWDDLRRLGERYRKLEKKCKEKAEVWKKLNSMPPPEVK